MKRVLITGGAGFIGSHMADRFLAEGAQVLIIDNLSSGSRKNISAGIELVECDIRSAQAQQTVVAFKPTLLIHAAAQISVSESMKTPLLDAEVNVCGLVNLLQAQKDEDEKPFVVFISTGGAIYGEQETFPAPESHRVNPESFYGLSKRAGEMYLDLWSRSYGLQYGVLRLSNVYGPRQNPHGEAGVVAIFSKRIIEGAEPTIFGDGGQTRDYVYVGDVVDAAARVAESGTSGTFNIGTGKETSVLELLEGISTALGVAAAPAFAPGRPGEQRRSVIDASLAKATFGWQAGTSLQKGLELTCAWFQEQSN